MEHDHSYHVQPEESAKEYAKFAGIVAGVIGFSVLVTYLLGWSLENFLTYFMAVFLLTFAAFKLINLEIFAITYSGYDLVTKKFPAWGYIFPFVEAGLGMAYVLLGNQTWLNVFTLLLTGVASVGVVKELRRKSKVMCACLGTVIRLPLSKISFVEDFLMFAMAGVMLLL